MRGVRVAMTLAMLRVVVGFMPVVVIMVMPVVVIMVMPVVVIMVVIMALHARMSVRTASLAMPLVRRVSMAHL